MGGVDYVSCRSRSRAFTHDCKTLVDLADEESGFIENILTGFGSGVVTTGELAALGGAAVLDEDAELAARDKIKICR